ncbi:MAG: hypothetical protein M3Y06_11535, partial [Actinomycetota bacterium]|nr:hypothetical protein [Actinomycetota bacterium]
MGHDDDASPTDVEFLDVGPRRGPSGGATGVRRWRRWVPLLVLAAVTAAVIVVIVVQRTSAPSALATKHPSRSVISSRDSSSTPGRADSPAAPVTVTELGHPLLGVRAGWELFARGDGVVIRIEPARGRITRTTVPGLRSDGPVSFVVGSNAAIVRPIDYVPGYLVPDGKPAREISASLSQVRDGPVFPGPDQNHVWI